MNRLVIALALTALSSVALLAALPGDANGDGKVDQADYTIWYNHYGLTSGATVAKGDFNGDGKVDQADYTIWYNHYGRDGNGSAPQGDPVLEMPTLQCLGVYWIIQGDENRNASVAVQYRPRTGGLWKGGYPLFRVDKNRNPGNDASYQTLLTVPADSWLFAGSIVNLAPDTEYEIQLTLTDPDSPGVVKALIGRTLAEPSVTPLRTLHVIPGAGGGSGTSADPYKGLAAAQSAALAGDLFLLHAGTYSGTFSVYKSGTAGKPILWRGAGDGETILDANNAWNVVEAFGQKYVWFEKLTVKRGEKAFAINNAAHCVIRRCRMAQVNYGVWATTNTSDACKGLFIADNTIEGPCTWPRLNGIENPRGVQITGAGHVVCYNRVRGFADALDVMPSSRAEAIDFHNNEISECTDDGSEMDFSQRNTRCFNNRFTNVFQGISTQPAFGGPVYIFRNAMYNVCLETFKMHNVPTGALIFHNTSVIKGMPLVMYGTAVYNAFQRNNLFIGSPGSNYAYENTAAMNGCDFDYDGFGGTWSLFLKWNGVRYSSIADAAARAPVYKRAVAVPQAPFASGVGVPADSGTQFNITINDLRLKTVTPAIDAGQVLPNFTDGYAGAAPDLGAYELGAALPQYGPRPEAKK